MADVDHKTFLERFEEATEAKLGISKQMRGFKHTIAKALNVRDSTVERWFQGSFPDAQSFKRIYEALGITPNYLLNI